jgi:hypothetical protein
MTGRRKRPVANLVVLVAVVMVIVLAHDSNWLGVLVFLLLGGLFVWGYRNTQHNRH